jgi:hypothetical protein
MVEHRFSLTYVQLATFLPYAQHLFAISNTDPTNMEIDLKNIIEERENNMTFNTSTLEDINERILIEVRGLNYF